MQLVVYLYLLINRIVASLRRRIRCKCYTYLFASCGTGLVIDRGVLITYPNSIKVGRRVRINYGVIVQGWGNSFIEIGDNVVLSYRSMILTRGFNVINGMPQSGHADANIKIGSNVWICANAVVLPGTVIEDNVVLAAGAVAKGVLKSGHIYAGIPAKIVK